MPTIVCSRIARPGRPLQPPTIAVMLLLAATAWGRPGDLDPSFGVGGIVTTDMGSLTAFSQTANAVALQAGRIVVGGVGIYSVARYDMTGTLDPSFGTGGRVYTGFGVNALAAQSDGKVVVGGRPSGGGSRLARLNADGTFDGTFAAGGIVIDAAHQNLDAVVLQPDGKIVTAGSSLGVSSNDFLLIRYLPDGTLDASFGTGGVVFTDFDGGNDYAYALLLQPDGKLVAAGRGTIGLETHMAFARYDSGGSLDPSFGSGGRAVVSGLTLGIVKAIALQANGKIVAVGSGYPFFPVAARINADGSFDAFLDDALAFLSTGELNGVAVLPSGRILMTGRHSDIIANVFDIVTIRDGADGVRDPGFGTGGGVITDLGGAEEGYALAHSADGSFIVAGRGSNKFLLARYLGGECGDSNLDGGEACDDGNVIDGDGCDSNCTVTACGNGIVTLGEACDDGNVVDGDCCSSSCQLEAAGSPCVSDGNPCIDDVCDGAGRCGVANSAPCDDGDACTGNDVCAAGTCAGTTLDCGVCEVCQPGVGCAPPTGCQPALSQKAVLKIGKGATSATNKLAWNWVSAGVVLPADFGDPTTNADYDLCVFDQTGLLLTASAPAGGVCAGKACWTLKATGATYTDKDATPNGLLKLALKAGAVAHGKIAVKGKGANLPVPALPLTTPVHVQLHRRDTGACWGATFGTSSANTATGFKAKSD